MSAPTWYCCQQTPEVAMIGSLAAASIVPPTFGLPKFAYDNFWALVPRSGKARGEAFLEIYGCEVVIIGEDSVEVVITKPAFALFWLEALGWSLSVDGGCPDGCVKPDFV